MRIVQALGWFYPESLGGTEVYVAALARLLGEAGHDVVVAAPAAGAAAATHYEHDGVRVFRYPISAAPTRDEAQGRVRVRGAEALHSWLQDEGADVVHVHTFVTGLGLDEIEAARRAGARVIVTTHSSSLGFLCQRGTLMWRGERLCDGRVARVRCAECALEQRSVPRPIARLLACTPPTQHLAVVPGRIGTALAMPALIAWNQRRQRRMFDLVDRFVVLSAHARALVVENGAPAAKIAINRLGVEPVFARPPRPRTRRGGALRIGYVGRFDEIKGVEDLAAAVRRLPPSLAFTCEFRGPVLADADRAARRRLVEVAGGDSRIRIEDGVDRSEIPALLASYDVVCYPSRCLEGGPTAGLEAMAVGTPVIAAAGSGLAECITDGVNGRVVPPGDVGALAAALGDVLADSEHTVDRWRPLLPQPRTMCDVTAEYLAMYTC